MRWRARWGAAALALLMAVGVAAGLAACDSSPTPKPNETTPPLVNIGPSTPVAFGAWAQPAGGHSRDKQRAAVASLQDLLGRNLAVDHFYVPDFSPVSTWEWRLNWDVEQGRVPMASIGEGVDTQAVAAGEYDAQLRSYAEAIRASGAKRVLIRYAYEMDGALNRPWVHSPQDFIKAWNHVRDIFKGLPVQMVWCPNAAAFAGKGYLGSVDPYWPGSDKVEIVAADGYNFYTCNGGHRPWRSFDDIFAAFLVWGHSHQKPMMVGEMGSVVDPADPNRQGDWLADAVQTASLHPDLLALVYYNSDGHMCDWRLDHDPVTADGLSDLKVTASVPATYGVAGA